MATATPIEGFNAPVLVARFDPESPPDAPTIAAGDWLGAACVAEMRPGQPKVKFLKGPAGSSDEPDGAHDNSVVSMDFVRKNAQGSAPSTLITAAFGTLTKSAKNAKLRLWKKGGPDVDSWALGDNLANGSEPPVWFRTVSADLSSSRAGQTELRVLGAGSNGAARLFQIGHSSASGDSPREPGTHPHTTFPYQGNPPAGAHASLLSAQLLRTGSAQEIVVTTQNNGKLVIFPLSDPARPVVVPDAVEGLSGIRIRRIYNCSYAEAGSLALLAVAAALENGSRALLRLDVSNPLTPKPLDPAAASLPAIHVDLVANGAGKVRMLASLADDAGGQVGFWPDATDLDNSVSADVVNVSGARLLPARRVFFSRQNPDRALSYSQNRLDIWALDATAPAIGSVDSWEDSEAQIFSAEFHPEQANRVVIGSGTYNFEDANALQSGHAVFLQTR